MSKGRFKVIWPAPMEEQFFRSDGEQPLRGKASGTALTSSFPCKAAIDSLDPQWFATGPILHTVITFGHIHVQMVVVLWFAISAKYCFTNSILVLEAVKACGKIPPPCIIAGGFNVNPLSLDRGATLTHFGLKDLIFLSRDKLGKTMLPTCKDTTITDNALMSPALFQFVKDIWVSPLQYFDAHRPVFVDLEFPPQGVFDVRLKQPKSWIELDFDDAFFPDAYQQATDYLGTPASIEDWGQVVEYMVDIAFRNFQSLVIL